MEHDPKNQGGRIMHNANLISVEDAKGRIDSGDALLVCVYDDDKFNTHAHLDGAIPLSQFETLLSCWKAAFLIGLDQLAVGMLGVRLFHLRTNHLNLVRERRGLEIFHRAHPAKSAPGFWVCAFGLRRGG